jgi:hypothetical protein
MLRAVLDTNVLVSAILSPKGIPAELVRAFQRGAFQLVLSPSILDEVRRVFHAPEIRPFWRLPDDEILRLLRDLERSAVLVPGTTPVSLPRDPDDEKFLAAALEAAATYIVTGDEDLRTLEAYQAIMIVSPSDFLRILERSL